MVAERGGGGSCLGVSGLRADGRRWSECRALKVRLGAVKRADGSAEWVQGLTRVLTAVYGPAEPERGGGVGGSRETAQQDRMVIRCEVHQTPSSSSLPVSAVASSGAGGARADRRLHELAIRLKDALDSVVIASEYPKSGMWRRA